VEVFLQAQKHHIDIWLTNPKVYLLIAFLLLVSYLIPAVKANSNPSPNIAIDYFYGVVHSLLLFPFLVLFFGVVEGALDTWLPWLNLGLASYLPVWAQILIAIFLDDFLAYVSHFLRHKFRFLWHFHTLHHSQENINPLTTKRNHPVEHIFIKLGIRWLPLAIIGSPAEVWALFYLVDAIWDYYIHSNIKMNLGPLGRIIVSPQYHRIHHSKLPQHLDKNFADRFVIWDILFKTAYLNQDEYPPAGLSDRGHFPTEENMKPWHLFNTYFAQMWYPFAMIYRDTNAWFVARNAKARNEKKA